MIPLPPWLTGALGRAIGIALAVLAALAITFALFHALTSGKRAKVEAKLEGGRADAALESGREAADQLGALQDRTDQTKRTVDNATQNVRNAPDAGAGDDAARSGLCQLSADYCDGEPLREPGSGKPAR